MLGRYIHVAHDAAIDIVRTLYAMMISTALAAPIEPASISPLADWLNVRPVTLWAAFLGSILFVVITFGPLYKRALRAGVSFVLAYLFTDATLLVMGWTSPAAERAVAAGFALVLGSILIAIVRRIEGRADAIADGVIEIGISRVAPGFKLPSDPPKPGGDDAPRV